jgi:hypothetical protein
VSTEPDAAQDGFPALHPEHDRKVKYSTLSDLQKRSLREKNCPLASCSALTKPM